VRRAAIALLALLATPASAAAASCPRSVDRADFAGPPLCAS
jgi:hypothetical protein